MNSEQRDILRQSILQILEANQTRFGLWLPALKTWLGPKGFPAISEADLQAELKAMLKEGLVETIRQGVSPQNRTWGITSAGRDHLAAQGIE